MRVRFLLRKSRINSQGVCPIECRVTINGVQATPFSTHIMVAPAKFETKAQRIKGASEKIHNENRRLETIKYELDQLFNIHRAKLVNLSAKELVAIYTGKKEVGCTYLQLCQKKIDHLKSLNRSKATIQIHERCHQYLYKYLGENLQATEIQKRHISGFWTHLKNKGYDHDYVNKTVSNCKSLFIFADKEGYVDVNPFKGVSFTWEDKLDLTCMEEWEMDALKNTKWSDKLQRVVDSFLFMCYQGLHISDYRKLTVSNVSEVNNVAWIRIGRTKTKVEATIPLHSVSKKIIEKYGDIKNLPKLSGQSSNDYLKIIAERIGTQKHLTNKVARKTFTDMCINEYRMSDESVAAMLGHKSTRFVKKYGAVRQNRIYAEWKDKIA
jgi:site-specific recombinase XerD